MVCDRKVEIMKIFFSPQTSAANIEYTFAEDKITVTHDNKSENYDFSGMPNGIAESIKSEVFEFDPVLSAKKENNILYLELLNFIGEDATEAERFPDWIEVEGETNGEDNMA